MVVNCLRLTSTFLKIIPLNWWTSNKHRLDIIYAFVLYELFVCCFHLWHLLQQILKNTIMEHSNGYLSHNEYQKICFIEYRMIFLCLWTLIINFINIINNSAIKLMVSFVTEPHREESLWVFLQLQLQH